MARVGGGPPGGTAAAGQAPRAACRAAESRRHYSLHGNIIVAFIWFCAGFLDLQTDGASCRLEAAGRGVSFAGIGEAARSREERPETPKQVAGP